ncbi:family 10 glycosylhydrolase [Egbenema bharatensis]|uniref:family 10 glycosylhydrolase n=1 Tax=Egbenema bharatensis TaxID=3463334 RepID=UPI003A8A8FCD
MVQIQPFNQSRWQHLPLAPSFITFLGRGIIAALVMICVYSPDRMHSVWAQPAPPDAASSASTDPQQDLVLGVVRSTDNADYWQQITTRLDGANLRYQVIDWDRVGQNTRFDNISVLFLPDVAHVSAEQVLALQDWVNRGGLIIASGRTGTSGSAGVRRAFQALLGAYWESTLSQPVTLQPVALNSQRWLREGDTQSVITGGTLIPTGLGSQSVATWRTPDGATDPREGSSTNTVAIITTRQTVFLGWRWGHPNDSLAEFDGQWLAAALTRFQNALPVRTATAPTAPSTPPTPTSPPTLPQTTPPSPLPPPPPTSHSPLPTPPPSVSPRPDRNAAPPGLVVEPGSRPISIVDSIAMRQELENLIGRYESALLAADATAGEFDLALQGEAGAEDKNEEAKAESPEVSLTASADEVVRLANNHTEGNLNSQILQEAREKLAIFLERVRQQDYATARSEWLAARQILWENLPTDRPLAQTEIRAMWLDRGTIVEAGSKQGLAVIFDRLAAAGINTVFVETVNAGYPIYPSQIAPQQNPLTRHWDPLEAAVELGHDRGMEIHAWVWTFAAGNEAHNRIVNTPHSYPAQS